MTLPIEFDSGVLANLAEATAREWLETNGIGGFASSTLLNLNTRRYHGLLVAATHPPLGRSVLLSKLEPVLVLEGRPYELGVNQYAGAVHPEGHRFLKAFRLDPFPVLTYGVEDIGIEQTVFLVHGENTVVVQYQLLGELRGRSCSLEIRPLLAFRDYHGTTHANEVIRREVVLQSGLATVAPYPGMPRLHFGHNAESLDATGFWYYDFLYERERERGLDYREDLYAPFLLRFDLTQNTSAAVIASTLPHQAEEAFLLEEQEIERRTEVLRSTPSADDFVKLLTAAADQFIVARAEQKSVIAGYPWFGDWGRDTMISLAGLTLATGRHEDARNILGGFAGYVDRGMLPNRFPEAGEAPEYNTADATLWMFHAVHEFLRYTNDYAFVRDHLYPVLAEIISWHERGTRYGIRLDADGLLHAGEPGVQLTWMDAKLDDWVVTPRIGKPVEIQALWYNALRVMQHLSTTFARDEAGRYQALAEQTRAHFLPAFWNEASGCLYDVIGANGPDPSVRPNQIFAVSLPYPLIEGDAALRVVDVVEWELLTPFGLRTLSPRDPKYRGRYGGNQLSRDGAYHQGTVWPWLLGPFLQAYVKVHGGAAEARQRADHFLDAMRGHLMETGLGQISEVFDGDAPHRAGGCIAQAWSVAEVLRTYIEDIQGRRPGPVD
ncbi:MAG TPA: amylo-alpha-1,6-glucosidase [Bryobacteraceae bacterium]|nr:amylo-alpha-1,6-glucosidase [Bryobacteraceae bacterium]